MATINDPKQIDPNEVVIARIKEPVTEDAQQPESSGLNHQVPKCQDSSVVNVSQMAPTKVNKSTLLSSTLKPTYQQFQQLPHEPYFVGPGA